MFDTFPKNGKSGKVPGAKNLGTKKGFVEHKTGFYDNQNLIGNEENTRMNVYSKPGTSAQARQPDPMTLSRPITRYRSRRP